MVVVIAAIIFYELFWTHSEVHYSNTAEFAFSES